MKKELIKALQRTEKEQKAINYYQGDSTAINELLDDFISLKTLNMYRMQVGKSNSQFYTQDYLIQIMSHIENLYSAMVKESMFEENAFEPLYRGSNQAVKEGNGHGFISTTVNKNEALLFATTYRKEKHYLTCFSLTDRKIPHIVMNQKENEEEILFSPFANIKMSNYSSGQWNGYDLSINWMEMSNTSPKEMSEDEIKKLEEEVLVDTDRISSIISDYIRQSNMMRIEIKPSQELSEKLHDDKQKISEWKSKFRRLMEGKCREVQKRIEKEVEMEVQNNKDLKIEAVAQEERPQTQAPDKEDYENALTIKSKIYDSKSRIIKKMDSIRGNFKKTGISYVSPTENIKNIVSSWNYNEEKASTSEIQQINGLMNKAMNCVDMSEEQINKIEENSFKLELAQRVMNIRTKQEMAILTDERENAMQEKISLWDKLTGKQKEKQESIREIDDRIGKLNEFETNLKKYGLSYNKTYSVHDILAEISIADSMGLSPQDDEDLSKVKKAIYGVFKVQENNVKSIVSEKNQRLAEKDRTDYFIGSNQDKISAQNFETSFYSNAEKVLLEISSDVNKVRAMEHGRSYGRDTEARR